MYKCEGKFRGSGPEKMRPPEFPCPFSKGMYIFPMDRSDWVPTRRLESLHVPSALTHT